MFTEWEITKREVGKEMEIFITLTKWNTCQVTVTHGEYLVSIFSPPHDSVQCIMRNGTYSLMFIGRVYVNVQCLLLLSRLICNLYAFDSSNVG